jgi:hypothetical protein
MHPVGYLFEDIYRNYWGITPVSNRPKPGRLTKPVRSRELFFRSERRQD